MKLKNLRVNNIEHPLGFQICHLVFHGQWKKPEKQKNSSQPESGFMKNVETESGYGRKKGSI